MAWGFAFSPVFRISAQAVPSGKGSLPCSSTMMYLRIGIMNRTPKIPPNAARRKIREEGMGLPRMKSAGTVKITPAAKPSPTEAMVWTRLFSKIVTFLKKVRRIAMERTAAGIDAETVVPIFNPR